MRASVIYVTGRKCYSLKYGWILENPVDEERGHHVAMTAQS